MQKPAHWLVMLVFALFGCTMPKNHFLKVPSAQPNPKITPSAPSTESQQLAKYYDGLQNDLLANGLLRRDGGGPDDRSGRATLVGGYATSRLDLHGSRHPSEANLSDPSTTFTECGAASPVRSAEPQLPQRLKPCGPASRR